MAFALSARSRARLAGVHPDLVRVVLRAIEITTVDFAVLEGVRSEARQRELYAQGRTKPGRKVTWTLRSNHFIQPSTGYGHAVDLVPFVDGAVEWDNDGKRGLWPRLAEAMKSAADELGVSIQWGGDWRTPDRPHFELKP
jgi:peptidoglycan L-alanyl-D-glutamate endopeptidase CwlK